MKLELSRTEKITPITGEPDIWFWVKATDDNNTNRLLECFRTIAEAEKYYAGLEKHFQFHQTYEPITTILKTNEITPKS